ncbi:uncharacterized protein LOC115634420 [Scaptodrosophila lebanonensis]|uniref:Uncharacterized protein LOC115634420 n=1 Tax=Drosophila lebanonensis TaxID=7225 RepID=A0A6J2UL81_DROLE|nr:uncharacterized protein LOC115634420 [Scaptodrosophila lebanonensis]
MYNPGYQVDVIDPYYPPPVEVIDVIQGPPVYPPTYIVEQQQPTQPAVVVVEEPDRPNRDLQCCMLLTACCVMEECGLCVIC